MSTFTLTESFVRSLLEPGVEKPGDVCYKTFLPDAPLMQAIDPKLRWVITDAEGECIPGVKAEGVFTLEEWETKVRNPLGACLVAGSLGLRTDRVYISGNVAIVETAGSAQQKNGKPYNNKYAWFLTFSPEGKIIEIHEYLNTALLERVYAENRS
ncbi:hypothetical protein K525DRAFT_186550 [Schizophyllum commune Loenen D]|nr:hypothetical protein K525DRAFT_186550 [Schizophyllum commune Loenen D]